MTPIRTLAPLVGFLLVSLPATAFATAEGAERYLQEQGLKRLSVYFALPDESEVTKKLRDANDLKKDAIEAQRTVAAAEKKIDDKKKLIVDYLQKRRQLRTQLASARTVEMNNRLVMMLNELADRITLLYESKDDEKTLEEAQAALSAATEKYVQHLIETRKMYDQVNEKYEDLAATPRVNLAVDHYSKAVGKNYRLGPGASFLSAGRRLKAMEDTILSEEIALRRGDGNLWILPVTFNGKSTQLMAIDTGASIISLPWKMAVDIGLMPQEDDPTIQLSLADGSIVQGWQKTAETVRVGKFTVKDVECAVMPQHLGNAAPLLGLSFFKHFTFKIDTANAKLVMAKVETSESGGR